MSQNVNYNGTTYAIPTAGELNWPNLTNFLVDVANSGAVSTKQVQSIRVAVTSPVTVGLTDCTVVTKLTVPAAVAVTLPAGVNGQTYIVHDGTGDAATNNVTVSPTGSDTINGAASFVLNRSKGAVVLQYSSTGTDWKVLDLYIPPGQGLPADQKALTASKVVVTDGSGLVSASTVTTTELGYVSGVTSAIQTQLNAKQATGNYVTALTGDVTATGPGSVAATVAQVGGKTASAVATSVTDTVAATNLNTNSTIVKRDGSGNFAAGTITAALTGNATTATTAGNVSGTVAIANGGTGQTAQTAAYDALNPNTTKGDLTVRGASNNVRLAIGTNGQVLTSDSTATNGLKWGDASAGAGEINAVSNPSAASATTGAAGDGVAHTVARNTANSPLDPAITTCYAITATANAVEGSTAGVGYTISTFPAGLRGRKNKVEFWITSPSADTWKVSVYTAGGTRMALSTDSSSATTITAGVTGKFTTTFDADATTTSYIVRFTRTAGTGTTTLYVTNLVVGPGIQPQGAAIGTWQTYTPTGTWVTNTTYNGRWRRVGDSMEVEATAVMAGAVTGDFSIGLPSGYTIDSSKLGRFDFNYGIVVGSAVILDASNRSYVGQTVVNSGSTTTLNVIHSESGNIGVTNASNPMVFGASDAVSVMFTVPIAEWAGSGTVNLAQNDVAYYYSSGNTWGTTNTSATTAQGPGGILGGTTTPASAYFYYLFTPTYPVPVGAKPVVEVSVDGIHWAAPGGNLLAANYVENLRYDGTNYIGASAGIDSSGRIYVAFGKYASGATVAWTGTWYWRVAVGLPGQAVGFANASDTSTGLLSYYKSETISGTMTGFSSGGLYSGKITRVGNSVTLCFYAQATGTKSGTSAATITIAAGYLPTTAVGGILNFSDNGNVRGSRLWTLSTGGTLSIFGDLTGSALANAAGCGFNEAATLTWTV